MLWAVYGYSLAFDGEGTFIGGFSKSSCSGVTHGFAAGHVQHGVVIPEYVFIAFQATFAAITAALIVGAFAERTKFTAVLMFCGDLVHLLLPADRAHGLGRRRLPAGQGARWTSRAARWCTSTPVSPAWWAR